MSAGASSKAAWLEAGAYTIVIALLGALLYAEGRRNVELQAQVPLVARDFYRQLASSQVKLQIIDARADVAEYEDTHIPGAIPLAGCDLEAADPAVRSRVFSYAPTVVVTADGDPAIYARCRRQFALARNLAGGMAAWSEAGYPEDSGEWVPPKNRAGGGCL